MLVMTALVVSDRKPCYRDLNHHGVYFPPCITRSVEVGSPGLMWQFCLFYCSALFTYLETSPSCQHACIPGRKKVEGWQAKGAFMIYMKLHFETISNLQKSYENNRRNSCMPWVSGFTRWPSNVFYSKVKGSIQDYMLYLLLVTLSVVTFSLECLLSLALASCHC